MLYPATFESKVFNEW